VAHHRRGITARFAAMRLAGASALASVLAVVGPGLLAGLSDDDPAGITTYSILGTEHGYRLLWIIPASTILLVQFHLMAVRIGAATGKGFVGIIRERWGKGAGYAAIIGLLFANFGTICSSECSRAIRAGSFWSRRDAWPIALRAGRSIGFSPAPRLPSASILWR
jgi:hypothetical protein